MENIENDPSKSNKIMTKIIENPDLPKTGMPDTEAETETKKNNKKRKIRQEKVEKIIKKWLELQKTIKEEITLEEVIIKQQNDDFDCLKNLFTQYYETKIQSRKQFENIKQLEKNMQMDKKDYVIEKDNKIFFSDSLESIQNLFFLF